MLFLFYRCHIVTELLNLLLDLILGYILIIRFLDDFRYGDLNEMLVSQRRCVLAEEKRSTVTS